MNFSEEIQEKLDKSTSVLEQVKTLLEDAHCPEVVYNKRPDPMHVVDDIALIQGFHGTDISRIRATIRAIEFNMQMTARPATWVFVECQTKKSDAAFGWLSNYGIKYKFVQMEHDSEGILLKNPMWNIGTTMCTEPRLCFLDSDVVMCNSNWLDNVSREFGRGFDVISLTSHQYYETNEDCKLYESIGYKWVKTGSVEDSHCGFTLGMTRKAFNALGGFQPALILDDINTYHRILGDEVFSPMKQWTRPFNLPRDREGGLNVHFGYAENVACHIWHGDAPKKYWDIVNLLSKAGIRDISDIFETVAKKKGFESLPTWKSNDMRCQVLRDVLSEYNSNTMQLEPHDIDIVASYFDKMQKLFGNVDETKHPLFVCTIVRNGFNLKLEDFIAFRERIETAGFNCQPTVVFATDAKFDFKGNNLNVIPLKRAFLDDPASQFKGKGFPKGSVLYYIPFQLADFETRLWVPDGAKMVNTDGTILLKV